MEPDVHAGPREGVRQFSASRVCSPYNELNEMPPIRASDVNEALEIAVRMKEQGKYDWFRGQLENWPVCPTGLRLIEAKREEALDKLGRFEHWIRGTPGLESLLQSPDMFFAVAQHYGLPTNYVDFTIW